ncbi:MAG: hypothetical protein WC740_25670 [Verrucomicrobiia bacterium]
MNPEEEDNRHDDCAQENYILNDADWRVVRAAKAMLWKVVRSSLVDAKQLSVIARILDVLDALPETTAEITTRVELIGPTRVYGDREILHSWSVDLDSATIMISSCGYFHRSSTGGDSFTALQWTAQPGCEADYGDYLATLHIVDDAQPFEDEVAQMNLTEPGYSLDTTGEDGESVGGKEAEEEG